MIRMMLTREQAIIEFRKMWNWIADETEKRQKVVDKQTYFRENYLEIVNSACWCCEYGSQAVMNDLVDKGCDACPIDFGDHREGIWESPCIRDSSPFDGWIISVWLKNWKSAAKYARQIANLPEREV